MSELLVLLAVGAIAALVIWLVALKLDEAGDFTDIPWVARSDRWTDKHIRSHLDRWYWGRTDRRLASMPELAGVDRLERRRLYQYAVQSLSKESRWVDWTMIPFYVVIFTCQFWPDSIGDCLTQLASPLPLVHHLPEWALMTAFTAVVTLLSFWPLAWITQRRTYSRLLKLFHQMHPQTNQ